MQVLVTSSNGRTGRPVVEALSKAGLDVVAFVRDAAQAPALEALGAIKCAVGDLDDAASLKAALTGCDKLVHIGPPMHPRELEITQSLVGAAQDLHVKHFVYYSVMHPLRRDVRHHRLKLDAEEHLIESELPYTIVQPCRYMQHLEPIWSKVVNDGVHAMPFDVTKKFSVVDLIDLARAVAVVTASEDHHYATYELAGPQALSQEAMAEILSEELGRTVTAREIPLDEMEAGARAKGASDDRVEQMRLMNAHYTAYGFPGNPHVLKSLLGGPPTDYRAYVARLKETMRTP